MQHWLMPNWLVSGNKEGGGRNIVRWGYIREDIRGKGVEGYLKGVRGGGGGGN